MRLNKGHASKILSSQRSSKIGYYMELKTEKKHLNNFKSSWGLTGYCVRRLLTNNMD